MSFSEWFGSVRGGQAGAAKAMASLCAALHRSHAVIEFTPDGVILDANENFLKAVGYRLDEIRGKHHRMFVTPAEQGSAAYRQFWQTLARGEYLSGQYRRIASGGREIWLQASYSPVLDGSGRTIKVVKFATDITAQRLREVDFEGKIEAISKAQAVIEFTPDGVIQDANENFLATVGYRLDEIRGQHHRLFVDPAEQASEEYRQFWAKLARGEYVAGQGRRLGKGGREIWLQASYNPIVDPAGRTIKVVKFATDVTQQRLQEANARGQLEAIGKSQAVIEFTPDGLIVDANENFLSTVGYRLDEIRGQHHRLFVDAAEQASEDYRQFWAKLARGEYVSGECRRVGKGGREIWLQASYNPIVDPAGRTVKVVKFASDITAQRQFAGAMQDTVREAGNVSAAAAAGDLTRRMAVAGKTGPLLELSRGVNAILDAMTQLVRQARAAADEVRVGADDISQGNLRLAQRTEEQASSLEETASSMEQMTGTVRQNADNASQANLLAVTARDQATRGGEVVSAAVRAMGTISESSRRIADITGVIDEIAFQTNLLALNAAVEAARAGEQGRGFAVVAAEVRSLAGRSAKAAREIKHLIEDSVGKVDEGSALVTQSGVTLTTIVGSVKKVTDIVAEISAASREQAAGIEQVNKAVMQLDQLTQQNASLVEQASASSQSVAGQARALNELLARYLVANDARESRPPAPELRPALLRTG